MKKYLAVRDDDDITLGKLYPAYRQTPSYDIIADDVDGSWRSHNPKGEPSKYFMPVETVIHGFLIWVGLA